MYCVTVATYAVKLSVLDENAAKHLHLAPSRHMGSTARKITQ